MSSNVKLLRSLEHLPADVRGSAVTIGNFDGVHRGHARILQRLISTASDLGGVSVVFTFDPHPVRLLRPESAPPPLTWTDRKAELLNDLGVDVMVAYPTDQQLLSLEPEVFFEKIVCQQLGARAMIEGPNFFFGRDRQGDIDLLGNLCHGNNISLEVVSPLLEEGEYISSSRVRQFIEQGQIDRVNKLLTQPYRIRGLVTHGAGRGKEIGFPTANIAAIDTLLPGQGVYAGRAISGSRSWQAAVNIGPNPTFGEQTPKVEVYLLDFEGSLYGELLEVDFIARLRDIRTFDGIDALKQQLARDVQAVRDIASH